MEGYITNIFILSPIIRFLCNQDRKWNKKWKSAGRVLTYVVLVLALMYKMNKKEKNCFQLLNVTPFSSFDDIRKSFKTVAFNLHPDRNKSETASADYANLVEKYKHISTPDNHYKYTRFFDLVTKHERAIHDMSMIDLITLAILKSFATLVAVFFMLFTSGETVIWHPLLVYSIFMVFFDLYLRLSDELFFTCRIPFIKYFVTFEILRIFNELHSLFVHHSLLFPDESKLTISVGANLLGNNLRVIDNLDALLRKAKRKLKYKEITGNHKADERLETLNKSIAESNERIKKMYSNTYNLTWSKTSKLKYDKLSRHGDKISNGNGQGMFGFLLSVGLVVLRIVKW